MSKPSEVVAKPNAATRDLWQSAVVGDADQLESLLAGGAGINRSNPAGFTALMLAAYHGHQKMVKVLIEHGADVNAGSGSFTAVKLAADAGHEEIVNLLIAHGGQKNQKSRARAKSPVRIIQEEPTEEIPAPAITEIATPVITETPTVPEVRTLHEPPDIWDMVHEEPAHFDSRSAFLGNLTSPQSLMVAAIVFVIAAGAVLTYIALPSWSWRTGGNAVSSQPSDNNAKTSARSKATPSRKVDSSRAQPGTARSTSNASTGNTAPATAFDQIAPPMNQAAIESAANVPLGVPVASTIRPAAKPRRQNGSAASNRATSRGANKGSPRSISNTDNTASAARPDSKETAPTSTTTNPKSDNEKGGSTDRVVTRQSGRAQSRGKKEGDRTLSPELIGPAKSSPSPKPKVIPWP